jgi:serine phosphatase RsbU (regulator of sigma subunit)
VAKSASPRKHLKLYTEQPPKNVRSPIQTVACLPELLRAFHESTGSRLQYVSDSEKKPPDATWSTPISGDASLPLGYLYIEPSEADSPNTTNRDATQHLARSLADLLGELLQTRRNLWHREAELAAGVPLVPHREEEKHLATRLESVLRSGVESIGGTAIALYLLDEATTELKMRCMWGLPFDRLTAPARPLKGAVADLEAMLGHAVVLDDERVMRMWHTPEDFPLAICVPVSTPTTLLGTLWIFADEKRDVTDRETNLLEIVAGRIATDLEREMLMQAGVDGTDLKKQIAAAERMQSNELPTIAPLLDGWDVAGWTAQTSGVGGAFHDWFGLPRGLLTVAVGKAAEQSITGALTANIVKTAVRDHSRYHQQAERVLQQTNFTLWTSSAGDQQASLFCGLIETATGRISCSSAGQISVLRLHATGWESLSTPAASLGNGPDTDFEPWGYELAPGEAMVIFTDSIRDAADKENRPLGETGLAEALQGKLQLSAEELTVAARNALLAHAANPDRCDRSIVVVKRTMA